MDRLVGESPICSTDEDTKLPFANSLLGGIKQVMGFFVMTEDELSQAGIYLGSSHQRDEEDQVKPLTGFIESDLVR